MSKSSIVEYDTCQLCLKEMKNKCLFCKCQIKAYSDKSLSSKVYKIKFNKNSNNLTKVLDITRRYIEFNSNSNSLDDNRSFSLIKYTHSIKNKHSYEWSNFTNIEQLSKFIIYSNKIQITEYIYRWRDDLKSIPRIQSFIAEHSIRLGQVYKPKPQYVTVVARPLLLVLKEDFWKSLIKSYFLYFHTQCVLFNLASFSTKTAPTSLLSAIYYAGFLMQSGHHEAVVSYMYTYAICNIKKILHTVKLSSVQALGIYACAFNRIRNPKLSRVCLHHLFRMADAMGLSINRRNIPVLEQYNRKTIYTEIIIHKNWTKLGNTIYSTLPEEYEENTDIHDPKYQLPNPDLNLHNNDCERIIYSVFCIELRKNHKQLFIVNNTINNYEFNKREIEICKLSMRTNEVYNNSKESLDCLINLYPEYRDLICRYILLVKMIFLITSINIHYNTIESSKSITFSAIESIIDKCITIHEMLTNNKSLVQVCSYFSLNAAFHLIKVYPHGTKKQCKKIYYILQKMVNFYIVEGFDIGSLDFIILKTQFDLLNKVN